MQTPGFTADTPLFILFNAGSGSGDKLKNRQDMDAMLRDAGRRHEFFIVERPDQISELAQRAAAAAVRDQGAVIVAGGDGTINAAAAATLDTGRPFGIVPQGTFNYSSRAHSIPLETVPATRALLDGRIKPVQVGKVNDRLFLVNASIGLYPQLLQDREAWKKKYGRKRVVAFWAGIMTLVRYRQQLLLEIQHDNQRETVRTPTLFVGNNPLQLEQVGLPEVDAVQHQRLAAVLLRPMTPAALLWLAVSGAVGRLGDAENARDFAFTRMTVTSAGHRAGQRIKVATDGEICWMQSPLEFRVAVHPLMLIVPAAAPDGLPAR